MTSLRYFAIQSVLNSIDSLEELHRYRDLVNKHIEVTEEAILRRLIERDGYVLTKHPRKSLMNFHTARIALPLHCLQASSRYTVPSVPESIAGLEAYSHLKQDYLQMELTDYDIQQGASVRCTFEGLKLIEVKCVTVLLYFPEQRLVPGSYWVLGDQFPPKVVEHKIEKPLVPIDGCFYLASN